MKTIAIVNQKGGCGKTTTAVNLAAAFAGKNYRTLLSRQIQQQMREFFGNMVFKTVIHRNVRLAEAPSAGEPVLIYAPESKATAEYRALAEEIINNGTLVEQVSYKALVRR